MVYVRMRNDSEFNVHKNTVYIRFLDEVHQPVTGWRPARVGMKYIVTPGEVSFGFAQVKREDRPARWSYYQVRSDALTTISSPGY